MATRINEQDLIMRFIGMSIAELCRADNGRPKYTKCADKLFKDIFGVSKLATNLSIVTSTYTMRKILRPLPLEDLFDMLDNAVSAKLLGALVRIQVKLRKIVDEMNELPDPECRKAAKLAELYRDFEKLYKKSVKRFRQTYNLSTADDVTLRELKAFANGDLYDIDGDGSGFSFFNDDPYYEEDDYYGERRSTPSRFDKFRNQFVDRDERREEPNRRREKKNEADDRISHIEEMVGKVAESVSVLSKRIDRLSFNKPASEPQCNCGGGHSPSAPGTSHISSVASGNVSPISNDIADDVDLLSRKVDSIVDIVDDMHDMQKTLMERYNEMADIIEQAVGEDDSGDSSTESEKSVDNALEDDEEVSDISPDRALAGMTNKTPNPDIVSSSIIEEEIRKSQESNVRQVLEGDLISGAIINTSDFEPIKVHYDKTLKPPTT